LTPTVSEKSQICEIWRKRSQSGNPVSGSPGHMRQNAYYRNLKWTFEDLL